ncbi:hypothetical protein LTR66_012713 [Elasticomyces elasticus]|nr:hypothetical protein LTR66_012713 [Elasticomyces elasticus]
MANPPRLQVQNLPTIAAEDAAATTSPARGKEMRANLLSKLRPPPLVHAWEFWHDRQDRKKAGGTADSTSSSAATTTTTTTTTRTATRSESPEPGKYEDRLVSLATITDVRSFWSVHNNFDIARLPLRDSIHLFHKGVKPVWEDLRNARGGAWTFRVPRERAQAFWTEVCMMAIGEQLQAAVASERVSFRDDVCGVSLSVRFTSALVQVWNRDAEHAEGVRRLLSTVLEGLSEGLVPKEGQYYYKRHSEHAGFAAPLVGEAV